MSKYAVNFEAMHWDSKMHTAQAEIADLHKEIDQLRQMMRHLENTIGTVMQQTMIEDRFINWFDGMFKDTLHDQVKDICEEVVDESFIHERTDFDYIEEKVCDNFDTSSIVHNVKQELKDWVSDEIDEKIDTAIDNLEVQLVR